MAQDKVTHTSKRGANKDPENGRWHSKYDPAFCEMIVDYFDQDLDDLLLHGQMDNGRPYCSLKPGKIASVRGFARMIGVHTDTLYLWAKTYPEFNSAKSRALAHLEANLAEMAVALDKPVGTMFTLKCKYGWNDQPDSSPVAVAAGQKLTIVVEDDVKPQQAEQAEQAGKKEGGDE